jgi:predicted ATPase
MAWIASTCDTERVPETGSTPAQTSSALILTPDQRLRVFVSSTLRELGEERAAVRAAISHLSLTPVMFEIGARPHPPRALYRSYLDQSHVFIGVYWESYGWVAPGESVSGLEDEYLLSTHLPRLLYVKQPGEDRDPELSALLKRIQSDDTTSYRSFQTTDELARLVSDDLMLLLSERFQATAMPSVADHRDLRLTAPAEPLTPIRGRDDELESLERLIADGTRLVTVTGTGGIGKSRLVNEVARRCISAVPIDVHFVDLTAVGAPESVPAEIAKSLGILVVGSRGAIESLVDHLADRRLLLVLDNFEHVVASAVALPELLSGCPGLQMLIGSRQVLRVRGEREFTLSPLPVPEMGAPDEMVRASAAVRLFAERAQAAQPMFELTADNLQPVAEICRQLDGLPLAVELAACRVRLLPVHLLLRRLETRLDLLSSGAADLPERQRTLRSAIDWSYNLLSADEQALFCRLSVFVDGWTLDAAEAVCACAGPDVLDTLVSLLEKSLLVVVSPVNSGEPRMRMLAPVHEYAEQKLVASGERPALQQRHSDYFKNLIGEHEDDLRETGVEGWSARLSAEAGNLRAAVHWWTENSDGEMLGRFAWATHIHYWMTGGLQEFVPWLEAADRLADGMSQVTLGRFQIVKGYGAFDLAGPDEAARAFEQALSLLEDAGDDSGAAHATVLLAQIQVLRGDSSAVASLQRVFEKPWLRDDPWVFDLAHWVAGGLALFAGDLEQAELHNRLAVELGRELGNWLFVGMGLERLALVHMARGRPEAAVAALRESVDSFRRVHYREGLSYDLQTLASVLCTLGDLPAAAEALSAAEAVHALIGFSGPLGMWSLYKPGFDALHDQLRTALGDRFLESWERGQKRDAYRAADEALNAVARVT